MRIGRIGTIRRKVLAVALLCLVLSCVLVVLATDYPQSRVQTVGLEGKINGDSEIIDSSIGVYSAQDNDSKLIDEATALLVTTSGDNATGYPVSSSIGNGDVDNGASVSCYSYWTTDGSADLDFYVFEHNATGAYANGTWTMFSGATGVWANSSINLDGTLGDVVGYRWIANSTSGKWNSTTLSYFTVSATITFVRITGVSALIRNDGVITNGTQTVYSSPTSLNMSATIAAGYVFDYWAWLAGTETNENLNFTFTVDESTTLIVYATPIEPDVPDDPVVEPPTVTTKTITLYYHNYALEVNDVTGYATLATPPNSATTLDAEAAGSLNVSWGVRVFVLHSSGSPTELTGGTPINLGGLTTADGNTSSLLSADYTLSATNLRFGYDALEFAVYVQWDGGAWSPLAVFVTEYLIYTRLIESDATFTLYVSRSEGGGVTTGTAAWGTPTYLSGVSNLTFKVARASDWQLYYLGNSNFLSFLMVPYTAYLGNGFYGLVLFGIAGSLYIRYRKLSIVTLFAILLGGVGGVINLVVGELFMGILWIAVVFGLAAVYWGVFR